MKKFNISNSSREAIRNKLKKEYDISFTEDYLENEVHKWDAFVSECEEGYSFNIEDYLNDIDIRTIIDEILSQLNEGERREVQSVVDPIDRRFKEILIRTDISLWGDHVVCLNSWNPNDHFWYFGFPRNPRGIFLDDLKESKLI